MPSKALLITESLLQKDPDDPWNLWSEALELLKLHRAPEALPIIDALVTRARTDTARWKHWLPPSTMPWVTMPPPRSWRAAGAHVRRPHARGSAAQSGQRHGSPDPGRRGGAIGPSCHRDRAQAALADFDASVPNIKTISAMKKWVWPTAALAGYEPLYDGLRKAGVPE